MNSWAEAAGWVSGGLLLYLAFFLHEDLEGTIQNRLETIWCDIDDQSKRAGGRWRAILQECGSLTVSTFNRIFGPHYISVQSVGTSLFLGLSSWLMLLVVTSNATVLWPIIWLAITLTIGALPAIAPKTWARKLTAISAALVFPIFALALFFPRVFYPMFFPGDTVPSEGSFDLDVFRIAIGMAGAAAVGGVLLDTLWVAANRKLLDAALSSPSTTAIVLWAAVATLSAGLLFVPSSYQWTLMITTGLSLPQALLRSLAYGALCSRLFTSAVSLLMLAIFLILMIHRVIWPVLGHIVYPLQRFGIFSHRKYLGGAGVLLITHEGWGTLVKWLFELK